MKRGILLIGVAIVVVAALLAVWIARGHRRIVENPFISESIAHQGRLWTLDFAARIDAPPAAVYSSIEHIENAPRYSSNIRSVKVLSAQPGSKTVELEILGPSGQVIPAELAFRYYPVQNRIDYSTLGSHFYQTEAEYQLKEDRPGTRIDFHQTIHLAMEIPVPDSVVKQALRQIFIAQIDGLKRSLDLN